MRLVETCKCGGQIILDFEYEKFKKECKDCGDESRYELPDSDIYDDPFEGLTSIKVWSDL